ncbi:MAG: hypothetical protein Q9191_001056 [Dirinaria sp. TL-2023a]
MGRANESFNDEESAVQSGTSIASSTSSYHLKQTDTFDVPDGGVLAWFHCFSAFLLFFSGWGIINSYGVYQTFYEQKVLSHISVSNVAWIGSLQAFLSVLLGVVAGPMYDHGFIRTLSATGTALLVSGLFLTSFAREYWHFMVAQGLMVGVGGGLLFLPGLLALSKYFRVRLALAQGIATSGGSLGGVIYPIVFSQLQPRLGFEWTTRVIALLAASTLSVPVTCLRMRTPTGTTERHRMVDLSAWRELPYSLFALAIFFGFVGFYVPFCYIQEFSTSKSIMNDDLVFYLLPILNAGAICGRIMLNVFADYLGPLNTLLPCTCISAALVLVWIFLRTLPGIISFCVLYGFFSGPLISLTPQIVANFCPDSTAIGTRTGMLFLSMAFGYLIGNPVAGVVLRAGWAPLQVFCAGTMFSSAAVMLVVKTRLRKPE